MTDEEPAGVHEKQAARPAWFSGRAALLWGAGGLLALGLAAAAARFWLDLHCRRAEVLPVVRAYYRYRCTCWGNRPGHPGRHFYVRHLGGPERALPLLRFYIGLPGWAAERRSSAVLLLATCGAEAVPVLLGALRGGDRELRTGAAIGLGLADSQAREIVPALSEALEDGDEHLRRSAAEGLSLLGARAAAALGALKRRLADPDERVRYWAVTAIGSLGPDRKKAMKEIIPLLGDQSGDVRRAAARALGAIGPGAETAVPALERALKDQDLSVGAAAREALKAIRGKRDKF